MKTKPNTIDVIAKHYLLACVFAEAPEDTNPRITKQAMGKAKMVAWQFIERIGVDALRQIKDAYVNGYGQHPDCGTTLPWCAQLGHDLWLTSHGHGAGFFDRKELPKELRDYLEEQSEAFEHIQPEFYRGWLYLHGNDVLSLKP